MSKIIKKQIGKNLYKIEEFESVIELVNANTKREVNKYWEHDHLNKDDIGKGWYGVDSYDEAYNLLLNGWEEGTKKVATLVDKITKTGTRKKINFTNNVHGFIPNVPLSIMNVPNSMIDIQTTQVKSKVLNVVYDRGASCSVSTEEILEVGLNVVNTIVNLEMSGYRVNLKIMNTYCNGDSYDILIVNVKNANQSLNLKKMIFPLANPAWLRVIGFDWQDKSPITEYKCGRGRPYYVELNDEHANIDDWKKIFGDTTHYINYKMAKEGTLEKMFLKK